LSKDSNTLKKIKEKRIEKKGIVKLKKNKNKY